VQVRGAVVGEELRLGEAVVPVALDAGALLADLQPRREPAVDVLLAVVAGEGVVVVARRGDGVVVVVARIRARSMVFPRWSRERTPGLGPAAGRYRAPRCLISR
jgi:hypothetical protein